MKMLSVLIHRQPSNKTVIKSFYHKTIIIIFSQQIYDTIFIICIQLYENS